MKVLIAGMGRNGKKLFQYFLGKSDVEIVAFTDNDESLQGKKYGGIQIVAPVDVKSLVFDRLIISQYLPDTYEQVYRQFSDYVAKEKIIVISESSEYMEAFEDQRTKYIKGFAEYSRNRIKGSVAECGVFRGDSAKYINCYFSERKLYLFDTFAGFDFNDLENERTNKGYVFDDRKFDENTFRQTSVDLVMKKMKYPKQVDIRRGVFPDTAQGLEDKFCFVNMDMDLYQPMLAGLEYFYERMETGGCLLLHDYFHSGLGGVRSAVEEYEKIHGIMLAKTPIGDGCSIAIIKQ